MVKRKVQVYLGDASGGVVTITEHGEVEVTGVAQSRVAGECSSEAELPAGLPNIQVATDLSEDGRPKWRRCRVFLDTPNPSRLRGLVSGVQVNNHQRPN